MLRPLDEAEKAANWKACRRYLRRYAIALCLPGLALIWAAGYGQGLLAGARECLPYMTQRNHK